MQKNNSKKKRKWWSRSFRLINRWEKTSRMSWSQIGDFEIFQQTKHKKRNEDSCSLPSQAPHHPSPCFPLIVIFALSSMWVFSYDSFPTNQTPCHGSSISYMKLVLSSRIDEYCNQEGHRKALCPFLPPSVRKEYGRIIRFFCVIIIMLM